MFKTKTKLKKNQFPAVVSWKLTSQLFDAVVVDSFSVAAATEDDRIVNFIAASVIKFSAGVDGPSDCIPDESATVQPRSTPAIFSKFFPLRQFGRYFFFSYNLNRKQQQFFFQKKNKIKIKANFKNNKKTERPDHTQINKN